MSAASLSTQLNARATNMATPRRMIRAPIRVVTAPAWRSGAPTYNRSSPGPIDPSLSMRAG